MTETSSETDLSLDSVDPEIKQCKECNEAISESNRVIANTNQNGKRFNKNVCKSCCRSPKVVTVCLKMQHRYPSDSRCEMC